jgi:GT2 family glycosyltransferase
MSGNPKPALPERPTCLTIILVTWNSVNLTRECIRSVLLHRADLAVEIIVVDNASTDGTVKAIDGEFPDVRVLQNDENVGFARACNQGMRAASSDLILLLNSDTYVIDDAIPRVVDVMSRRPDIGMLACQLRWPDGSVQPTAARSPTIRKGLLEDFGLYWFLPRRRWGKVMLGNYWDHSEDMEVDWIAGAFMLLRRAIFFESGGFDERFFMYGEDCEWCTRLRRNGVRILYSTAAVVFHVGGASSLRRWTSRELIRVAVKGHIRAYSMINGSVLGFVYNMTRLLGSAARTLAYALASLSGKEYFRHARLRYRWYTESYAASLLGASFRP